MNKPEAIELLRNEGWTTADAQRALTIIDFRINPNVDELTILHTASRFAGAELLNGDFECGTTAESQAWVKENSDWYCPICSENYCDRGGRTIDHKLPRSQYPWLSLEWSNLWVICRACNHEKGEKNWYEYEQYIYHKYPQDYPVIRAARPVKLLDL